MKNEEIEKLVEDQACVLTADCEGHLHETLLAAGQRQWHCDGCGRVVTSDPLRQAQGEPLAGELIDEPCAGTGEGIQLGPPGTEPVRKSKKPAKSAQKSPTAAAESADAPAAK